MIKKIIASKKKFESFNFKEKKDIIHIIENSLRSGDFDIANSDIEKFIYDNKNILKRITYYLWREFYSSPITNNDIKNVVIEFEKVSSSDVAISLTPLYYSIRLIKRNFKKENNSLTDFDSLTQIFKFLKKRKDLDSGNQIKENLGSILGINFNDESVSETCLSLIEKGEVPKAIRFLLDNSKNHSIDFDVIRQLSCRINKNNSDNILGIISRENYLLEFHKISAALISIIGEEK